MKNKKNKNTLHRLFEFAGSCKGLLLSSVVFAVLGAGFGIVPYIAVSRIIIQICAGDYSLKSIMPMAVIALINCIYGAVSQSRIYYTKKYSYCTYEKVVTSAHGICLGYPVRKIQNDACRYG